jgi:hypothetical protein
MTKFMDRLDLQIRLHLTVRHMLVHVTYNFGKFDINSKLENWNKLSWKEFLAELEAAGIIIKSKSDKEHLKEIFDEQKKRALFLEDELSRHAEIIAKHKIEA